MYTYAQTWVSIVQDSNYGHVEDFRLEGVAFKTLIPCVSLGILLATAKYPGDMLYEGSAGFLLCVYERI